MSKKGPLCLQGTSFFFQRYQCATTNRGQGADLHNGSVCGWGGGVCERDCVKEVLKKTRCLELNKATAMFQAGHR